MSVVEVDKRALFVDGNITEENEPIFEIRMFIMIGYFITAPSKRDLRSGINFVTHRQYVILLGTVW